VSGTTQTVGINESSLTVPKEPHKVCGWMNPWEECVRPWPGKYRWCISYNVKMSIYPGVFQVRTPWCWVHLHIPVPIYLQWHRQSMLYYDVVSLVAVTKANKINKMRCSCEILITSGVSIWHQGSHTACAEVSAALEVSCRPLHRSLQLQNLTIVMVNHVASCKCSCRVSEHIWMLQGGLVASGTM